LAGDNPLETPDQNIGTAGMLQFFRHSSFEADRYRKIAI
jgi:hypothetical protein